MNSIKIVLMSIYFSMASLFISCSMSIISFPLTEQDQSTKISRESFRNFTVFDDTSFIGNFSTSYKISGNSSNILNEKEIIIKSIIDDFGKSPAIGYIKTDRESKGNDSDDLNEEIANPFASIDTINEKIKSVINEAIKNYSNMKNNYTNEIKCDFNGVLDYFKCYR